MAEEATLKDTLASDAITPPTPEVTPEPTEPVVPRIVEAADPAAAKIGEVLIRSGWTEDKINDLLQAPVALEHLRSTVLNNPQEFLNMVGRADPKAEEIFLERMADTYVQRYGDRGDTGKPEKGDSSGLLREVEALREQTNRLLTEQQRRDQATATAAMRQRLDARVDDLFGQVKELGLKPSEQKALRARLFVDLSNDNSAAQRVSNGNFVDVPRTFQTLIDEWASDRKSAADAEKAQRDRQQSGAFAELSLGAQAQIPPDLLEKSSGSWDDTENALAKALMGGR